jgi:hypothetical protein
VPQPYPPKEQHSPLLKPSPIGHLHSPPTHSDPPPHITPHPPQFTLLAVKSVQTPLQPVSPYRQHIPFDATNPEGQPHVPPLHAPPEQTTPHEPQFAGSAFKSLQTPLQAVCPGEQHKAPVCTVPAGQAQPPSAQIAPPEHAWPHAPQLLESLCGSTHVPPHMIPYPQRNGSNGGMLTGTPSDA